MGFHPHSFHELASGDDYLAHARLPVIRVKGGVASFYKCVAAFNRYPASLSSVTTNDSGALAERLCSGGICYSSIEGGVGGVDSRAKGCLKRRLFYVNTTGVRPLRASAITQALPPFGNGVRFWPYVQAYAGHASVRPAAFGLLATRPL